MNSELNELKMPYLIFCAGEEKEAIELNTPSETSIGRAADNSITVLDDTSISRKHLLIKIDEKGTAFAEDLGSNNGTTINNTVLSDAPIEIPNGALIKAGDAEFLFCYDNFEKFADASLPPLKLRFRESSPSARQKTADAERCYVHESTLDAIRLEKSDSLFKDHSEKTITPESPTLLKGEDIEGYRVIRTLGEGYFSKTYLAYQKSVDRTVALKIFRIIQDFDIEEAFKSFKSQILKTANVNNPRIMHYFDCGLSSRMLFISMPYLSEGSLKDKISKNGNFFIENAVKTISIVVETLNSLLLNSKVLHLSLNPSNIVYNDSGDILLTDYALKPWKLKYCIRNEAAQRWTRYDSPELRAGEAVNHLSDIYSLGVLLCEMLTGVIADDKSFNLKSAIETCKSDKELMSVIQMATEPSRNLRIQSYEALTKMLRYSHKEKKHPQKSSGVTLKINQHQPSRKIIIKQKK